VESELDLAYGQLSQLLRPVSGQLSALPPTQAKLLGTVTEADDGGARAADRFAVGLATLALLAEVAASSPVLVVVDDLQWVDQATADTLVFVARRLLAEQVVILLACRDEAGLPSPWPAQLPTLRLGGLGAAAAAELLAEAGASAIPAEQAARLALATGGNPLALIDLPRLLSPDELRGTVPLQAPVPIGGRLVAVYQQGIDALPDRCRQALLIAGVLGDDDVPVLEAALTIAGLAMGDLGPAEDAGLLVIGPQHARFRHPLVRSALTHGAKPTQLRRAHRVAGQALIGRNEPHVQTRQAWHLAAATAGTDEAIAQLMENEAARAARVAGFASASHAYQRAGELTPDAGGRGRRLLAAADTAFQAGHSQRALDLAARATNATADPRLTVEVVRLKSRVATWSGYPRQALDLLKATAAAIEDPLIQVGVLLDATYPAGLTGDTDEMVAMMRKAFDLTSRDGDPFLHTIASLALATTHLVRGEPATGLPLLPSDEQMTQLATSQPNVLPFLSALGFARLLAETLPEADRLIEATINIASEHGLMSALPFAMANKAVTWFRLGDWRTALAVGHQANELAEATARQTDVANTSVVLAHIGAGLGDSEICGVHGETATRIAAEAQAHAIEAQAFSALGLLELGRGDCESAISFFERTREICQSRGLLELGHWQWAPELTEALVRAGRGSEAEPVASLVDWHADRTGRPIVRAWSARCRGLLAEAGEYEAWFAQALGWHAESVRPFEEARTRLCFGERLRRARKKTASREQLTLALGIFTRLGAQAWAGRARHELQAAGVDLSPARGQVTDVLTAREMQVALAIASGATTRQTAEALFLSPKTVEYHQSHVYQKLGAASRDDLRRALKDPGTG
jgi:DNA-binding CsgD family transcriptional regulator/tetratricopeptide (TPR) repeat protein